MLQKNDLLTEWPKMISMDRARMALVLHLPQNYFQCFAGQQAGSTPGQLACTSLKHGEKNSVFSTSLSAVNQYPSISHVATGIDFACKFQIWLDLL